MAELMRCKSCGYVIDAKKLGEVCPACGVPRKMFEPWTDPVSPKRRKALELDLHPIVVHFPVAFAASALVVSIFVLAFPRVLQVVATSVLFVMVGVLPLMVIAGFLSGMYDGRLRFRRVTTPLLKRKMRIAGLFYVFSLAAAVLSFAVSDLPTWVRALDVFLLANCLLCAVGLGKIGTRLIVAMFPG
jgi:rubredoxin